MVWFLLLALPYGAFQMPTHLFITHWQYFIEENTWIWPLTFYLDPFLDLWSWYLTLRLTLYYFDALKNKLHKIILWRHLTQHGTSYASTEWTLPVDNYSRNIFQPTRSLYDFRFKRYGSKNDFHGYWRVWPWHFKVVWYLSSHIVFPCMTGVNVEAICSLIAEIQHFEIWKTPYAL